MTRPAADVLAELTALREADPPTHGGRVLSYVYDHGRPELDRLAEQAATAFLPVNGLDPTTFRSVAVLERALVARARTLFHGDDDVVGSVTSGGTESCLLAVKTARDVWRAADPARAHSRATLVLPTTAHPAFHKAAAYLDLDVVAVPVDVASGRASAADLLAALDAAGPRAALVVVSAPSYPFGVVDPVAEVAAGAAARGVACHVDACIGGFVLPWWGDVEPWDLAVPGVTSLSADLHKYGYAPKGVSLVLHRGRDRHRAQYFATTAWPGYPVVNPTVLGSRAAGAMAAAWAVGESLGDDGYADLVARTRAATATVRAAVDACPGMRVVGEPTGPLLAVADDGGVDPFHLVDALRRRGWLAQSQPAMTQPDGTTLPRTAHLTLTAVTDDVVDALAADLVRSADEVRGVTPAAVDPSLVERVLTHGLPDELAGVMATLEALPADVVVPALVGVLQAAIDPGPSA
ncbi:pyridoxal phosphate-dependent decarboxylase family protein [Cellulomonas wangsupingiae]|uniref:Aminotransferase class V-fold PLP-dependent enzyme n=1 Tax=Cellulomonas wangsupingiae TaxID=2968085 RepID=A0ABY5K7L6_9CELL|nr:aminotransferase class V-fold PLP-dependent enzyme [Cellulomonas wangsupingiae]MCC2334707.1 aminotransferase class V-fold PLP-dependent enzyme [Cellulomonas wangsupingiae]MCM0638572.1 aminotransferase class V-fold PLP-dependent enzyme [Cellulomonas wangsupingiae]UUI66335.1 aminotransferase class V-fold PLP-dependent enzyme [Cellulomonas wangsupingiae]